MDNKVWFWYEFLKEKLLRLECKNASHWAVKANLPEIVEIVNQFDNTSFNNLSFYRIDRNRTFFNLLFEYFKSLLDNTSFKMNGRLYSNLNLPKTIFVLEHQNHLNQLYPIIEQLKQRKCDFSVYSINNLKLKDGEFFEPLFFKKRIRFGIANVTQKISINFLLLFKLFNLNNIGLNSKIRAILHILTLVNKRYSFASFTYNISKNNSVFRECRFVYFKSEGYQIRSLVRAFGSKNFAVQHGYISRNIKYTDLPINHYLVWSDYFAKVLKSSHANTTYSATGSPQYDLLLESKVNNGNLIFNPKSIKIIFLPNSGYSQTPMSELQFAIDCFIDLTRKLNIKTFVKPHPGGDEDFLLKKISSENIGYITKTTKLNLGEYDVIVTMNSTIGLEAALHGIPIIILLSNPQMLMVDCYIDFKA